MCALLSVRTGVLPCRHVLPFAEPDFRRVAKNPASVAEAVAGGGAVPARDMQALPAGGDRGLEGAT